MARNLRILVALLILIIITSINSPIQVYGEPRANSDKDWQYVNGNSWGWNYSPQSQINKNNVQELEVKWLFPIGSKSQAPDALQSLRLSEGAQTPPIVKNGIVYITTNFLKTYAIDAELGKQLWVYDYTFDPVEASKRLPWKFGMFGSHLHGFGHWESGNSLIFNGMVCDLYAVDATSGVKKFHITDLCLNINGNIYSYRPTPSNTNNVGIYEKGRQFVTVIPGMMHSTIWYGDGRHVTLGIDMDDHSIKWRIFSYPPQDRLSRDWALEECNIGFFQEYSCLEIESKNRAGLEWDWTFEGEKPSPYGGVTANWGQMIVDEDSGIIYTNTGNQGPYTNLSLTPGPRLYGSTIMAIDLDKGQRIWWLQPFPHDPYDYDCNWSGILAEVPSLGKVYIKGCKEGRLYILEASTGKPINIIDVAEEQKQWGQIADLRYKYHLTDPFSFYDLREWGWPDNSKYCGTPCVIYPMFLNGLFSTDMSYDPETQTLYHYASALSAEIESRPYIIGHSAVKTKHIYPWNSTIVARDVATGNVKWTWFYKYSMQRAHLVVTGGVLYSGFTDGGIRFFDKDSGDLLYTVNVGSPVVVGPSIGKDLRGESKIFLIAGSTSMVGDFAGPGFLNIGPTTPGTLIALGLAKSNRLFNNTVVQTTSISGTLSETETVNKIGSESTNSSIISEYILIVIPIIFVIGFALIKLKKTRRISRYS